MCDSELYPTSILCDWLSYTLHPMFGVLIRCGTGGVGKQMLGLLSTEILSSVYISLLGRTEMKMGLENDMKMT